MKRALVIGSALLFLATCSERVTSPQNNKPRTIPFDIAYTTDDARAVSVNVPAASGGVVTVQDEDGITFTLTVPPRALKSDATIKATPLLSLHISGPGGSGCDSCGAGGGLCCLKGVLFEPAGLSMDSLSTLTVRFPSGLPFPFKHGGLIACVDSAGSRYEICPTACDTLGRCLTAKIKHFSGYATDEVRRKRIEAEIAGACDSLDLCPGSDQCEKTHAFERNLFRLKNLRLFCNGCAEPDLPMGRCFPDLVSRIEQCVLQGCTSYVSNLRMQVKKLMQYQPYSCDGVRALMTCYDNLSDLGAVYHFSNWSSFSTMEDDLTNDAVTILQGVGGRAKTACAHDSCTVGRDALECAYSASYALPPQVQNTQLVAQLRDSLVSWRNACCKISITLTADKAQIRDIALSADDRSTVVTFTVTARDEEGPIANENVYVEGRSSGSSDIITLGGLTDGSGVIRCSYFWCYPGCMNWVLGGIWRFNASISHGGQWVTSAPVDVEFKPLALKMEYNYSYLWNVTYSEPYPVAKHEAIDVHAMGVTAVAPTTPCVGSYFMTRSWHTTCQNCAGEDTYAVSDFIDYPPGSACFFGPHVNLVYDAQSNAVSLLVGADVDYQAPLEGPGRFAQSSSGPSGNHSDTLYTDRIQDYLPYYAIPKWHGTDGFVPFVNGSFRSMTWDSVYEYDGPRIVGLSVDIYVEP